MIIKNSIQNVCVSDLVCFLSLSRLIIEMTLSFERLNILMEDVMMNTRKYSVTRFLSSRTSRTRVESRTALSCSMLEIFEFDRTGPFARLELENFERTNILNDSTRSEFDRTGGVVRLELDLFEI